MRSLPLTDFLRNLAAAFLDGPWEAKALRQRGRLAFRGNGRWLPGLVRRMLKQLGDAATPGPEAVYLFLRADARLARWRYQLRIGRFFWVPNRMTPQGTAAQTWAVPCLTTAGELAAWLGITVARLDWFADVKGLNRRVPPSRCTPAIRAMRTTWPSRAARSWSEPRAAFRWRSP
jgi:RNA-directed DNA polymerase